MGGAGDPRIIGLGRRIEMAKPGVFDGWVAEAKAFAQMTQADVDFVMEDIREMKYEETLLREDGEGQRAWKRLEMALTAIRPLLSPK